jgi:hypothetical protein
MKNMLNDRKWINEMKYLLIIGLCLSVLLLSGCGLLMMDAFAPTVAWTKCVLEDSETNRLKVIQVVQLIADLYGFEDSSEEFRARNEQEASRGYTFLVQYYAPAYDEPPEYFLRIEAYVYTGKVYAYLVQRKKGKGTTKEYTEIQSRWISELKERFGEEVDIEISTFRP